MNTLEFKLVLARTELLYDRMFFECSCSHNKQYQTPLEVAKVKFFL